MTSQSWQWKDTKEWERRVTTVEEQEYLVLARSQDVREGEPTSVVSDGEVILLTRVHGQLHAVSGICTHAYSELADGELDGTRLYCSLHFACFDVRTGAVLEGPAEHPLRVYPVFEQDGDILLRRERRVQGA